MDDERVPPASAPTTPTGPATPEGGPGLAGSGWDPAALIGAGLAALGLIPIEWFDASLGVHAFGPLQFPAILAITAVLSGFLAVLRWPERGHRPSRDLGILAVAVALARVLLYPLVGW